MEKNIKKVTPVEYELEIEATPEDLAEEILSQLRAQRSRTVLKGFRKGKVPLSLVKKLYGRELAFGVAERSVQQSYEETVVKPGEHDVLGHPKITVLDYEMDGPLRAVIRFGVRPEFEIKFPKRESISKLIHVVTDEEVDHELEHLRESEAELVPVTGPVGAEDFVVADVQTVDASTGMPLIGQRRESATFYLGDERLKDEFKQPLVGASPGSTVRVTIPKSEESEAGGPTVYDITINEIKRKELPDLDDEFASNVSRGRQETVEGLRAEVRERLQKNWDQRSSELLETTVVEKIVALNPIDVPESVVDMYLDAFVEDLRKNGEVELPADFDEEAYRERRREDAVQQARWMLIKDKLVGDEGMEVTEEDRAGFFDRSASEGGVSPEMLRQYYQSIGGLTERLDQRLLTEKVIAFLSDKFKLVEKDRKAFEKELEKQAKKNKKK